METDKTWRGGDKKEEEKGDSLLNKTRKRAMSRDIIGFQANQKQLRGYQQNERERPVKSLFDIQALLYERKNIDGRQSWPET